MSAASLITPRAAAAKSRRHLSLKMTESPESLEEFAVEAVGSSVHRFESDAVFLRDDVDVRHVLSQLLDALDDHDDTPDILGVGTYDGPRCSNSGFPNRLAVPLCSVDVHVWTSQDDHFHERPSD